MALSKPFLLLSTCNGLHFFTLSSQIHTSSPPTLLRLHSQRPNAHPGQPTPTRPYTDHSTQPTTTPLPWPPATPPPTPYQIFALPPSAPYSKRRFYELVKLYHPDRHHCHHPHHAALPFATKVERYRLVVAANAILSSPEKRSQYDRYGAGWGAHAPNSPHAHGPRATAYRDPADSPHHNATWEDWERWYQRDARGPQEPRFFANGAFVALVVMLATLGGVGQATRAGNQSLGLMEERERLHDETSKELMRRRSESLQAMREGGERDGRIRRFLEERERDPRFVEMEEEREREVEAEAWRRVVG